MMITIKREELLNLDRTFDAVSKMPSTRFAYAIAKNKRKIQDEIESIKTALSPPPKVMEFEERRRSLVLASATKNKDGQPDIDQFGNARLQDIQTFEDKLKVLKEQYQDDLAEYEKKADERKAFLSEPIELDLFEIPVKHLPKDLKAEDLYMLMPILNGGIEDLAE